MRRRYEAAGICHALQALCYTISSYAPKPSLVAVGPRGLKILTSGGRLAFSKECKAGTGPWRMGCPYVITVISATVPRAWRHSMREAGTTCCVKLLRAETVIEQHWAAMGKYGTQHRTKLVVDEWAVWYRRGEETTPGHLLSQPLTLRVLFRPRSV
jgi:alpha-N-arabinofuranosidase